MRRLIRVYGLVPAVLVGVAGLFPRGSVLRRRLNLAAAAVYRGRERLLERRYALLDCDDDTDMIVFELGEREAP
ncbi:MAG: hypothetical protein ICV74_06635 [Thermoleophilia bacterium]|nr:hypothetical protein [Thermoleophilia bacterium]